MLRRLKDESGVALVLALMTMTVMTIAATTAIYYATSSQHESYFSKASSTAYRLAQSGLNNAMATLGSSQANAMSQTALPTSEGAASQYTYPSGKAEWWGTYNSAAKDWTLYGKGIVPNPVASSAPVTREVKASMSVTYSYSQPVNVQAWNYVYLTNVGGPNVCDVTTNEDVDIDAPLYIYGNLCFRNNSHIREDMYTPRIPISVSVIGKVQWAKNGYNNNGWGNGWNNDWWGSSIGMNPGNTVSSVYVGGGCGWSLTNVHTCTTGGWNGWNWSKDPIYPGSGGFSTNPPAVTPPVVNWTTDGWYQSASPGPLNPCTTVSGTPPAFDGGPAPNNTQQNLTAPYPNGSLPSTVNLTPTGANASYTCKTADGELSWNAQTETLTVRGVIYIDGNATLGDGNVDQYVGQATLYASGYVKVNGRMCGIRKSGWGWGGGFFDCDYANWNPNVDLLVIAAHGNDGNGSSFILSTSSDAFQGGVYAANAIDMNNSGDLEGPIIAGTIYFGQNADVHPFPPITSLPEGAPGNPNLYAQPNPPGGYSG